MGRHFTAAIQAQYAVLSLIKLSKWKIERKHRDFFLHMLKYKCIKGIFKYK